MDLASPKNVQIVVPFCSHNSTESTLRSYNNRIIGYDNKIVEYSHNRSITK